MQQKKAVIAIPLYKKDLKDFEKISLKQGLSSFRDYDVIIICPESFDESWIDEYRHLHQKISFQKFSNHFFVSPKSYTILLLTPDFYERFAKYDFMLIYQTDAYVFSNQLEYWCNKGFDYIGAPWFKDFDEEGSESEFIERAGNGGFSLRNVALIRQLMNKELDFSQLVKFKKLLRETRTKANIKVIFGLGFYLNFLRGKKKFFEVMNYVLSHAKTTHEDYFFAWILPSLFPEFKSAKAEDAIPFAFECQPEKLFEMNEKKLPFGCHAWQKYSPEFWKKFIDRT